MHEIKSRDFIIMDFGKALPRPLNVPDKAHTLFGKFVLSIEDSLTKLPTSPNEENPAINLAVPSHKFHIVSLAEDLQLNDR